MIFQLHYFLHIFTLFLDMLWEQIQAYTFLNGYVFVLTPSIFTAHLCTSDLIYHLFQTVNFHINLGLFLEFAFQWFI